MARSSACFCGRRFSDSTNSFRAFSRPFLIDPRVAPFSNRLTWCQRPYYLAWSACRHGFRVAKIPVTRAYPRDGPLVSKITTLRAHWLLAKPFLDIILGRY